MRRLDAAGDTLAVECYSGYKGDERPLRFRIAGAVLEIESILDRWHEPEGACFRVRARGAVYILRRQADSGIWSIESCRAHRKRHQP